MSRVFTGAANSFISTAASAVYNNLTAITVAAWVFASVTQGFGTITVKDPAISYSWYFEVDSNGSLEAGTYNGIDFSDTSVSAFNAVPVGAWTHVAFTFDWSGDKKFRLYANGVETQYITQTVRAGVQQNDSGGGWFFGNDQFSSNFVGSIGEIAVWNTVLTADQLAYAARSTAGISKVATSNLVGYWHLCGLASPEPDSSGNGNSGTVSNSVAGTPAFGYVCSPNSSVVDSRNYGNFPNSSRVVDGTSIYDVQTSSNSAVPGTDSRAAGAPVSSGLYPQNSRS